MEVRIRPYREEDLTQTQALNARVEPYRPEDEVAIEEMKRRARQAKEAGDERWAPIPPPLPSPDDVQDSYLAFWVAVLSSDLATEQVVGMVGVDHAGRGSEMPFNIPVAQQWCSRLDVAELRYLRVAPEFRRQGIRTRLNQTAIEWCRHQGFHTLICYTTAAQLPALSRYQRLGFCEVCRSFVGEFELVWLELTLATQDENKKREQGSSCQLVNSFSVHRNETPPVETGG